MIRWNPFRRKPNPADAGRTLSQLAAAEREARQLTYRQAVRARALEMARNRGLDKAVRVLSR
ncbi:hypothetical protein C7451_106122 [Blastomonas natatoria]|uniref:Uncharacterized protein n=1 Tax=Blastomonas natatoria TaxID=34015 RepID=A0A2V3V5E7_9SPHN|nr:hypothetical protein [Blastomonas natatoria]PXW75958.1 hypothetical protein C7451_106122 [Blastomonas natatoria]